MADLPAPPTPTLTAIYASYEARQGDGFRDHLGASIIGKSCARALWYDFRWVMPSRHSGRLLRLFETGQLEEDRLVRNLRTTGASVLEVDPETGRQFRVEAHGGHFGGSLDGVAISILEAPKTWHVLEFKTHGTKSFADLTAKGVLVSKPQHGAQMQIYMHLTGITRALYMAVCKNTDALHIERVEANPAMAERLLDKAGRVADFIELGELMCLDALERNESCGGHFREEYQTPDGEALRDDENYMYVAAWEHQENNWNLHKEPLNYEVVKPSQRSYK